VSESRTSSRYIAYHLARKEATVKTDKSANRPQLAGDFVTEFHVDVVVRKRFTNEPCNNREPEQQVADHTNPDRSVPKEQHAVHS
jgi:hypothetical protein